METNKNTNTMKTIEETANEVMLNKIVPNIPKEFLNELQIMITFWMMCVPSVAKEKGKKCNELLQQYKSFGMENAYNCGLLVFNLVLENLPTTKGVRDKQKREEFNKKFAFLYENVKKVKTTTKNVGNSIVNLN